MIRFLMASPTFPELLLCRFMTQSLFIFSPCVATPLNGFRKNDECMTPKQKWYVMFTFFVWMLKTCTIITWTWLASVINLGMCTNFITGCVITSGGDIFYFGDMASSLPMRTLFTKHFFMGERWIPWVVIIFGVWFAWIIFTPKFWRPWSSSSSGSTQRKK